MILWVIYICLTVFVAILGIVRIIALTDRMHWRDTVDGVFPQACGDWAEANGCTRITLEESGCTRPLEIPTENSIVFETADDEEFNNSIASCINDLTGAKVISPAGFSSSSAHEALVHVAINSVIFGFIDDLYLITQPYGVLSGQRVIALQS